MSKVFKLPTTVVPSHYEVNLTPNPTPPFNFTGSVKANVDVKEAVTEIVLHAYKVQITSAEFVAGDVKLAPKSIDYDVLFDQTVTLTFETALPVGEAVLTMNFNAEHGTDMAGFYRSEAKARDGSSYYMLVTQFEPTDARRCLPLWDEPAVKATYQCTLNFPKDFTQTALSNTPVASDTIVGDKRVVSFEATPRMSSYLLAFVVGDFDYTETTCVPAAETTTEDKRHTVTVRVYTAPGISSRGEFAATTGARVLEYLAGFYDVGYPLPKLDMVAIPDFAAGAMENWGLITYRETALLCDQKTASVAAQQRVAYVVAHELAHQWFGNLVTMKWWDELWLNEGYATYVGTQAVDHVYPEWQMWSSFVTDYVLRAMSLDAKMSTHPVQVTVGTPAEINEIFDAISYCKGASLIRLLVAHIGIYGFRTGIRAYLRQHKYGNASTNDLFSAMSDASGVDVEELLDRYIRAPGFPVVRASMSEDGKVVLLSQRRYLASGESAEGSWPLHLRVQTDTGIIPVIMNDCNAPTVSEELTEVIANGGFILLNANGASYHRSEYDDALLSRIVPELSTFSAPGRLFLFSDVWSHDIAQGLRITCSLTRESDSAVWTEVATTLDSFRILVEASGDDTLIAKARAWLAGIYRPKLQSIGMEQKEGDRSQVLEMRGTLMSGLAAARDPDAVAFLRSKFVDDREALDAVDPNIRSIVYAVAGRDAANHPTLRKLYQATEEATEKNRLLVGCAIAPVTGTTEADAAVVNEILDWALPDPATTDKPAVKPQDAFSVICICSGSSFAAQQLTWKWLQSRWARVVALYGSGQFLLAAIVGRSFGRFVSNATADEVEAFFAANVVESAKRSAAQSVEGIRARATKWAKSEADVRKFFGL